MYDYGFGVQPVCEAGLARPFGPRVLLRAILSRDFYSGGLWLPMQSSTDADCFEVVAIGGGVARWCEANDETPPKVGQHVEVRSTAADRVDPTRDTGRYWNVHIEDVSQVWDWPEITPEIQAACERIAAAKTAVAKIIAASTEADLQPASPIITTGR